jgi:hypothetical protein
VVAVASSAAAVGCGWDCLSGGQLFLYGWLGNQPAPALSQLTDYLWRYGYCLSALLAFAVASVFAERQ